MQTDFVGSRAIAREAYYDYRLRHGSCSLQLYFGRGGVFVCEQHDDNGAVLLELYTRTELIVTAHEFKAGFFMLFRDDMSFSIGSQETQEAVRRELEAHVAAVLLCLEKDRRERGLLN